MIHLPVGDGQILFWDYGESNPDLEIYTTNNWKIWDFTSNSLAGMANTHNNMFCGSHCQIWMMFGLLLTGELSVTAPPNSFHAPPGYYMLFLISRAGNYDVPSIARCVKIEPFNLQ